MDSTRSASVRGREIVAPGAPLNAGRLSRYSRQLLLPGFGDGAQRRLAAARVLVVGAGGLGSASIPYLASAGVGTIGIIDDDDVELSNLHRQTAHGMADIGRRKVDSLADTIAAVDPEIIVHRHHLRLDAANALEVLDDYDLVLDGSDNFQTRYLTNDATALAGKPLVWGAILRYSGQAGVSWAGVAPTYRDLFPAEPGADAVLSCSVGGVLPSVCAVIGSIMSSEALKLITGIGEPLLGRVTTYDALTGRFRELEYESIPDAAPVTSLTAPAACAVTDSSAREGSVSPTELAGRLSSGTPLQLIDVREPFEAEIASIMGAELIPLGTIEHTLARIRRDIPVVVYCHHGSRARQAVSLLQSNGHLNIELLEGGIDAYARLAEPTLARY